MNFNLLMNRPHSRANLSKKVRIIVSLFEISLRFAFSLSRRVIECLTDKNRIHLASAGSHTIALPTNPARSGRKQRQLGDYVIWGARPLFLR